MAVQPAADPAATADSPTVRARCHVPPLRRRREWKQAETSAALRKRHPTPRAGGRGTKNQLPFRRYPERMKRRQTSLATERKITDVILLCVKCYRESRHILIGVNISICLSNSEESQIGVKYFVDSSTLRDD